MLNKVINQGATSGEFTAQQSLTDSIFELAGDVPQGTAPKPWSPMNPRNRYDPLVPHRFASTFTLPLFTGQIKAYTQGGPNSLASTGASSPASPAGSRGLPALERQRQARHPAGDRHGGGVPGRR